MQNKARKIFYLLFFFIAFPISSWAQANCPSWNNITWNQGDTSSTRPYRINTTSNPIAGLTNEEVRYSAILALDTLTAQGGAAAFQYVGTTNLQLLPVWLFQCNAANINFNLVATSSIGTLGTYHARCRDPNNLSKGTKFEIFSNSTTNWGVGSVNTGIDLVMNWMHEGMHTYNVLHPPAGVAAVIQSGGIPGTRVRDLYEFDLDCIEQKTNHRNASQTYRVQQNGSFGSPQALTVNGSNGGISLTKNSNSNPGVFYPNTAYRYFGYGIWRPANTSFFGAKIVDTVPQNTIGWSPTVWREQENRDLINYSNWRDDVQYATTGKHEVRQLASTNGFSTNTNAPLYSCLFMIAPFYCSFYVGKIYSGKKTATAWDSSVNRTQFAWANQNRLSNSASRQILISTGRTGSGFLMPPFATGFQTHVSPGLACGGANSAGTYDCVLAYVPQNNTIGRISFRRFYAVFTGNQYILIFDPVEYTLPVLRTASAITLWYHQNKYWMAFRTTLAGQPNVFYSSSNGSSWSYKGLTDYSEIGPSAVSFMESGNNYLSVWE